MDALLAVATYAFTTAYPPMFNETKTIIESYFASSNAIIIISDDPSFWNLYTFKVPLTIKNFNTTLNDIRYESGIILDLRPSSIDSLIDGLLWDGESKFLIVTEEECPQQLIEFLWKEQACSILILANFSGDINVCVDIKKRHCFVELPLINVTPYDKRQALSQYVLSPDLFSCKVNVSYMDFPPYALYDKETKVMSGTEGRAITFIAAKLGMEASYLNCHETGWGVFEPLSGLIGDVVRGRSIFGFSAFYPFVERNIRADLVTMFMSDVWMVAVPVGAGKSHPTYVIILVSEFSSFVWLCVLFSYLFLIPITYGIAQLSTPETKGGKGYWSFHLFALIIGQAEKNMQSRVMMLTFLMYGFLITSYYKSVMSSKLTAPAKVPNIETLDDLLESGLPLIGPFNAGRVLRTLADSPTLRTLGHNFVNTTVPLVDALETMVRHRNISIMRHKLNLIFSSLCRQDTTGMIHLVEEPVKAFAPTIMLKKNSCFSRRVQDLLFRICGGGFTSKWEKDASEVREVSDNGVRKLNVNDIVGSLLLISLCWGVSFAVFIGEYAINRIKKGYKQHRVIVVRRANANKKY